MTMDDPTAGTMRVSVTNERGQWIPAIPLPLYVRGRKRCDCGQRFWTEAGYRGHYAYRHILGMPS